nr:hypothetical protein CFP56_23734 [Quercus suber]
MEELKVRYFMEACYRTNKSQMDLARFVRGQELKIRHCYAENFHEISKEDFVKMILLDCIFIIEHLWRTKQKGQRSSDSNGTSYPCECTWRVQDLCLITCKREQRNQEEDNQESEDPEETDVKEKESPWLSYNILQDLYDSAYQNLLNVQENEDKSFHKFVRDYFKHFWKDFGLNCSFNDYQNILEGKQVRHLTDFLRYFLLPPKWKFGKSIKRLPCATKLAEAGVEFKKVKNRRLLDISFRKNWLLEKCPCLNLSWNLSCFPCFKCLQNMQPVFELQSFIVGDATECVIRNLMAFEQCHYPREVIICNYIVLLDHLINTAEDVDLLVEKKILVNKLL